MQKKNFILKDLATSNAAFTHNVPLVQIKKSRSTRHVSVDGQIVLRTCTNGSLEYHKYQDIEAEAGPTMEKWMTKKLVATTVSNRTVGIRRRMEG